MEETQAPEVLREQFRGWLGPTIAPLEVHGRQLPESWPWEVQPGQGVIPAFCP